MIKAFVCFVNIGILTSIWVLIPSVCRSVGWLVCHNPLEWGKLHIYAPIGALTFIIIIRLLLHYWDLRISVKSQLRTCLIQTFSESIILDNAFGDGQFFWSVNDHFVELLFVFYNNEISHWSRIHISSTNKDIHIYIWIYIIHGFA